MASEIRYLEAKRRAKTASLILLCVPDALPEALEAAAAWTCGGDCGEERDLRMLCLELVASHRRTGQMDVARVLRLAKELRDFGLPPDTSRPASPAPRRGDRSERVFRR